MILNKQWVNYQNKEHKPKGEQTKLRVKWLKTKYIKPNTLKQTNSVAMLYN